MTQDLIIVGDCIEVMRSLPAESVHTCVSSPPYYALRNYGVDGQIGQEDHHDCLAWARREPPCEACFVCTMRRVYAEVWRVLHPTGTAWMNLGDGYAGSGKGPTGHNGIGDQEQRQGFTGNGGLHRRRLEAGACGNAWVPPPDGMKAKDLMLMPARVALALQADGWWVRSDVAWCKKSSMPESVDDRPVSAWEHIFLLAKSQRYFYDNNAVREPHAPNTHASQRGTSGNKSARGVDKMVRASGGYADKPRLMDPRGANLRNFWVLDQDVLRLRRDLTPDDLDIFLTFFELAQSLVPMDDAWLMGPEPFGGGHYATYPPKIPERAILAGTSEHGACPVCLSPWARKVEPTEEYAEHLGKDWADSEKDAAEGRGHCDLGEGRKASQRRVKRKAASVTAEYRTVGWEASCKCGRPDVVHCTVLDMFFGAGTSGLVARRLGRRYIGIELNDRYAEIAFNRINTDTVMNPRFPELVTHEEYIARFHRVEVAG